MLGEDLRGNKGYSGGKMSPDEVLTGYYHSYGEKAQLRVLLCFVFDFLFLLQQCIVFSMVGEGVFWHYLVTKLTSKGLLA